MNEKEAAQSEEELDTLRRILTTQQVGVLATSNAGQPYCTLVGFSISEDLKTLFFATPRTTRKFAYIQSDGRVSMMLDDRAKRVVSLLRETFEGASVAVRSSAPVEDSAAQSFAGLHESYLNIRDTEEILKQIQLVWASLWSDGAILYRKELGLDIEESAMAVLVQEFVTGSRSGVAFSQHPLRADCVAIEAVHGLNQGLVDGMVERDRWTLDKIRSSTGNFGVR